MGLKASDPNQHEQQNTEMKPILPKDQNGTGNENNRWPKHSATGKAVQLSFKTSQHNISFCLAVHLLSKIAKIVHFCENQRPEKLLVI